MGKPNAETLHLDSRWTGTWREAAITGSSNRSHSVEVTHAGLVSYVLVRHRDRAEDVRPVRGMIRERASAFQNPTIQSYPRSSILRGEIGSTQYIKKVLG